MLPLQILYTFIPIVMCASIHLYCEPIFMAEKINNELPYRNLTMKLTTKGLPFQPLPQQDFAQRAVFAQLTRQIPKFRVVWKNFIYGLPANLWLFCYSNNLRIRFLTFLNQCYLK